MNELKKIRISFGKNQKEMAELFDITQSAWSMYESGQKPLSNRIKYSLVNDYNVNPLYLTGECTEMYNKQKDNTSSSENRETLIVKILEMYNKLEKEDKELITKYINAVNQKN